MFKPNVIDLGIKWYYFIGEIVIDEGENEKYSLMDVIDSSDECENENWPLLEMIDSNDESENENWPLLDVFDSNDESENQSLVDVINNENRFGDNVQLGGNHGLINDSLINIISKNKRFYKHSGAAGLRLEVQFRNPTTVILVNG